MERMQTIQIKHFDDGSFTVDHHHKNFKPETYIVKSKTGLVPVVRNLINGKLPFLQDLYVQEGARPTDCLYGSKLLD